MDWFLYDNGLRHERVKVFDHISRRATLLFLKTTSVGHLSIADSVFCALYHLETLNSIFFITFFYVQP